jgi:hypothetical protein
MKNPFKSKKAAEDDEVAKTPIGKQYKARNGAPFKVDDAQVIGETIDKIKNNNGDLKPEYVVKEAKKKSSVLHDLFEWDNTEAGEKWRIAQARNIINHIMEVTIVCEIETEQRGWQPITSEVGENVYVTSDVAVSNPNYRKQLIDRMISTMENLTANLKYFRQHDYP